MLPRPPTSTLFPYTTLFRSILFFRSICLTKAPIFHPSILCSCYVQQSHALYFYNNWDADYETTPTKAIWLLLIWRSEEHTSELQSRPHLVCRLLLEKKKKQI